MSGRGKAWKDRGKSKKLITPGWSSVPSGQKSYESDTILLQCHAVTLTFKVATQILHATRHLDMAIISVK